MWIKVFVKALPNTVTSLINSCLAVSLPDNICISNAQYSQLSAQQNLWCEILEFWAVEDNILTHNVLCGFLSKRYETSLVNEPLFYAIEPLLHSESTYKKCLREEWGKFAGYQLLSSFWLKVARTDEDRNTTRWDRGTLPIRNLYPKWGKLRFGRIKKVTNWIWMLWFIVSY